MNEKKTFVYTLSFKSTIPKKLVINAGSLIDAQTVRKPIHIYIQNHA